MQRFAKSRRIQRNGLQGDQAGPNTSENTSNTSEDLQINQESSNKSSVIENYLEAQSTQSVPSDSKKQTDGIDNAVPTSVPSATAVMPVSPPSTAPSSPASTIAPSSPTSIVSAAILAAPTTASSSPNSTIAPSPFIVPHIDHLPEQYRNMRFQYRFRDPVKHGLPHSSRGKYLALRLHSPIDKLTSSLPAQYSLRDHVAKVLDQGTLGACVAHSGVQAVAIVTRKQDSARWTLSRLLKSSSHFYGSRLFLYDNARRIDGTSLSEDSGTTNLSGCIALEKHKLCDETIWPYVISNFSQTPPNTAYVDADRHTVFRYSVVNQDITSIKKALASGHPVMVGIVVFPSFIQSGLDGRKGNADYPHHQEVPTGGHSLLLIGYDDSTQRFTFVNHWTTQWGDNGFGTLPYRYVEDSDYAGDLCAIEEFA